MASNSSAFTSAGDNAFVPASHWKQAYCRIGHLVQAGVGQRQTASVSLRRLAALGIVRKVDAGREKLYVHEAFARLLFTDGHEE